MEHIQAGRTEAMTVPKDLRKMAMGHKKGHWRSVWKELQGREHKAEHGRKYMDGSTEKALKGAQWEH